MMVGDRLMVDLDQYKVFMASADAGFAQFLLCVALGAFALYQGLNLPIWGRVASMLGLRLVLPKITLKGRFWRGVGPALAVGLLLRLVQINDVLWFDESFTAGLVRLDLLNMLQVIMADVHPPTNYLVTWFVTRVFGSSEVALRLPALFAGVALIWLGYRLALAFGYSSRVGLLTAWLIALMPAAIKYANEARQYSLMACLVFALVIALLENKRRWFVVLGVAVAWCHNIGFAYLAVLGLVALLTGRGWRLPVILSWAIAALWLPGLLYQSLEVADGFWLTFSWPGLFMPLFNMTLTGHMPDSLALLAATPWLGTLAISIFWSRRWLLTRRGFIFMALFAGVPFAVGLVSATWQPIYLHRALLPAILASMPVLAHFLVNQTSGRWLWRTAAFSGLFIALAGFFTPGYSNTVEGREMQEICAGADAVYNTGLATQFLTSYYIPDVPSYLSPVADNEATRLPGHALERLGWSVVENPLTLGRDVCVLVADSPFSHGAQYMAQYLKPGTFTQIVREYHDYYWIYYYRISTEGA